MNTPTERSVEEILRAEFLADCPFWDKLSPQQCEWIVQRLTQERKKRDEMVEAEKKILMTEIRKKYWLNIKRTKGETAKDNAWNDLGNTLRNGV